MIRAIRLNDYGEYIDGNNDPLYAIYDLSRINIFVGANNSGKSRLIRRFITDKRAIAINDEIENDEIARKIRNEIDNLFRLQERIKSFSGLPTIVFDKNKIHEWLNVGNYYVIYREVSTKTMQWMKECGARENSYISNVGIILSNITMYLRENKTRFEQDETIRNCVYIPVLRGIENYDTYFDKTPIKNIGEARLSRKEWEEIDEYARNSKKIYENKIAKAYTIKNSSIFTAESLYDEIRNNLLGTEEERKRVRDFQDFISKSFYDGKGFTIIPREKILNGQVKEFLSVKIGNSEERELYNLGDGIKQLITIFYKIFEKKDEVTRFFIEEPEINLHPGFQTKLISTLNNKLFEKHQFFIVTHSNHFLSSAIELSNDISIYKITNINDKNCRFRVEYTSPKDVEILNLLGAKNTSVLMANCIIFVEGLSDKIYLRKYLEIYFKENGLLYKEDIHYAFAETGGGNIAHWDFTDNREHGDTFNASSFSNRSFVICDNDNGGKKKRKEKLKAMVGENNFYELGVREIENSIKKEILEKTLFGDDEPRRLMERGGYYNKKQKIGEYIDSHYNTGKKYADRSGTIKNKIDFAKKSTGNMNGINDLTEEAIRICEKISDFIRRANG